MNNEHTIVSLDFWNKVAKKWVQKVEHVIEEAPDIVPMEHEDTTPDFDPFNLDDI